MREDLETLIQKGTEEIIPSPALLQRAEGVVRPIRVRRMALAGSVTVAAAVFGFMALLPQRSSAEEVLKRTFRAWSETAAISYRLERKVGERPSRVVMERWFTKDRTLTRSDSAVESWWDVTPDQVKLISPALKTIQISYTDASEQFMGTQADAYGFLKTQLVDNLGPGGKREMTRFEENLSADGVPAYALNFESSANPMFPNDPTTYRMVVDRRTNLPISLTSKFRGHVIDGGTALVEDRYTFEYNQPIPDVYRTVAKGFDTISMREGATRLLSLPARQTPFGVIKWAGRASQRSLLLVHEGTPPNRVEWKGTTWLYNKSKHKIDDSFNYSQPADTSGWGMAVFAPLTTADEVFQDLPFPVETSSSPYPRPVLEAMAGAYLTVAIDYASAHIRYEEFRKLGNQAKARQDLERTVRDGLPGRFGVLFEQRLSELNGGGSTASPSK